MKLAIRHPQRRQDDRQDRRLRKGISIIPSLFTSANIAMGYYAIVQVTQVSAAEPWHFDLAAKAIGAAVLFDSLDGFLARLMHVSSDFGRELDSLADVVTFGVAPALLAFMWGFHMLPALSYPLMRTRMVQLGAIASLTFLIAGASRLARFNIQINPQPSNPGRPDRKYFVGMPIPAAAGVLASAVHYAAGEPLDAWWQAVLWLLLVFGCAFLMVSTWRFFSTKGIDPRSRHPFQTVVLVAVLIAGLWQFSRPFLVILAFGYLLSGIVWRLQWIFRRRPGPPPLPPLKEVPAS